MDLAERLQAQLDKIVEAKRTGQKIAASVVIEEMLRVMIEMEKATRIRRVK